MQTVHLAVYDTLADWEVGYTIAHVNNGYWQLDPGSSRVVTVGETAEPVTTMGGVRVLPDLELADLRPEDSAMLILPGAETWLTGGNTAFVEAAAAFLDAGIPVAAICGATVGLAAAGLLDARAHTSNAPEILNVTGYQGSANYLDAPAVTAGELITASGVNPVEFAREIFTKLGLYDPGVVGSWYKLYGKGDPAGFEELMAAGAG